MDGSPHLFQDAPITRDRDQFLRELLRQLAGVLEETVGLKEAQGFISTVGNRIGEVMDAEYRTIADVNALSVEQIAAALVDLKARIKGDFRVDHIDAEKIVLSNKACPFAEFVKDRPSLCMMTSNVFGRIAANNLGYARVSLEETIAQGAAGCRVVVYLTEGEDGREYFG